MSRKPLKVIASLAAAGLLAAACGSSSSTGPTSTTVKPHGSPILVGQIDAITGANHALPEAAKSVAASVAAVNNAGGINGHPLQLIQCDTKSDPNTEVQCAQTMVSDHVVATLYDNTYANPAQVQGILTAAGIPRIGIFADSTVEYGAKTNFDFTAGAVFCLVGMMDDLIKKGDKKLTVILPDSPSAGQTHLLFDPIAKAEGAQVVNYVLVSSASGDYSQYVAQAQQNGAQGIVIALANAQIVQFAQAINQLNPKIDYTTGIAGFSLNQFKQLGQFATKAGYVWYVPGIDDTKNFPGLKQVLADVTANEKGASINTLTATSVQSWLAVHAFSEVMKSQTGTPTAASVLAAFQAAKNIPMNGIVKPWTPTAYQNAGSLNAIFPYISNPWIYRSSYNGKNTVTIPSSAFNVLAGL